MSIIIRKDFVPMRAGVDTNMSMFLGLYLQHLLLQQICPNAWFQALFQLLILLELYQQVQITSQALQNTDGVSASNRSFLASDKPAWAKNLGDDIASDNSVIGKSRNPNSADHPICSSAVVGNCPHENFAPICMGIYALLVESIACIISGLRRENYISPHGKKAKASGSIKAQRRSGVHCVP